MSKQTTTTMRLAGYKNNKELNRQRSSSQFMLQIETKIIELQACFISAWDFRYFVLDIYCIGQSIISVRQSVRQ